MLLVGAPVSAQPALVGNQFRPNTYTTGNQGFPGVAVRADGTFVIVWDSFGQDGDDRGIFAQRFDRHNNWVGPEFQVNTYTTGAQYPAEAAIAPNGNFVVVWNSADQDGDFRGIFAQLFDGTGDPVGGEFQVNAHSTGAQYRAHPAMAPDGSFVIVWNSTHDGTGYGIFARRFDSSGTPIDAEEFPVDTYNTGEQSLPGVGMNGSGEYVITWESDGPDGDGDGVFARRFDMLSGPIDAEEFQVNTYTTGPQRVPRAAMQENGDFVVVWKSTGMDGDDYGILARRFDSAGAPLDPEEFVVNTYTTGQQREPSVALDASGAFMVTWEGGGVFARSFEPDGTPLDALQLTIGFSPAGFHDVAGGGTQLVAAWHQAGIDGSGDAVLARRATCDQSGNGLCDRLDVALSAPTSMDLLDCSDPRFTRPTIEWRAGNYEKFRVYLASSPNFVKGTSVTSGDTLLKTTTWTPSGKKWRNACNKAIAANPSSPALYIQIFGVDVHLPKRDPLRKTLSEVVQVDVAP